jgi:hypothetical protein
MTTVLTINERQKMTRKSNASAKSKELQSHPPADTVSVHLLLPQRTITVSLQIWLNEKLPLTLIEKNKI